MSTCPNGHDTQADDYCDTCGATMGAAPTAPAPSTDSRPAESAEPTPPESAAGPCPNCAVENAAGALFCEACGYDYTTGSMPRHEAPSPFVLPGDEPVSAADPADPSGVPAPAVETSIAPPLEAEWVAELWIDPDWYAEQESPDPLPSAGPPDIVALRNTSLLVGRESQSRDIHPDIDCGTDNGVSRRHAQLTTDGTRWWVEDLGSSNGTFVGESVGDLPETPIDVGVKQEVGTDHRIYLGSWTRLVIRPADPGEI